jgi:hypothetical protein
VTRPAPPASTLLVAILALVGCSPAPASPSPSPRPTGLPAGTYSSTAFRPPVSFTVPAGWVVKADTERYFELQPAISDLVGIYLFRSPLAASQDRSCPDSAEPGVGTSSSALSAWITGLEGLQVSGPRPVTVGGLRGAELDVRIATGWSASCPFANGLPAVPLFVGPDGGFRWVVAGTERLRLHLLDAPDGATIVVDVDAFDGALMADLLAAAGPIVRSMVCPVT